MLVMTEGRMSYRRADTIPQKNFNRASHSRRASPPNVIKFGKHKPAPAGRPALSRGSNLVIGVPPFPIQRRADQATQATLVISKFCPALELSRGHCINQARPKASP
jgi:hypothetical protein